MSLFQGLSPEEVHWAHESLESQYLLPKRSTLYQEGEKADTLYTLYDGWMILFKCLDNGKRQILRFVLPGDLFGFQVNAINGEARYTHGSHTLTESTLCAYPRSRFRSILNSNSVLAIRFAEMGMYQATLDHHHLVCTGQKNAKESVTFLILELLHRVRQQLTRAYDEASNSFFFPLYQEDIGDALGLTAVHVNRTLMTMKSEGLIQYQNKRLTILDEAALMEIGEFDPSTVYPQPVI